MIRAHQYSDARTALRAAYAQAPAVVGWKPGGWLVYTPTQPADPQAQPEMLVLRQGVPPIPLSETGGDVLRAAFAAQINQPV